MKLFSTLLLIFFFGSFVKAQGKMYPDGKGGQMYVPNGDISFADEIIYFKRGTPQSAKDPNNKDRWNPKIILGPTKENRKHFTMGCYGELTVKFTDNVLMDIPGPDLFIFEVGTGIEPVVVLISKDNENWIFAGVSRGGTSDLDISEYVKPNEQFFYVKLIDVGSKCSGTFWDGSDMIGIAALGTVQNEVQPPEMIDQRKINFKRTVIVESDKITVSLWDNQVEDGDIISLNVNGEWVLKNFGVKNESDDVTINLKKGENYIVLHAENLGSKGLNTAALKIDDGQMQQILELNSDMNVSEGIKVVR